MTEPERRSPRLGEVELLLDERGRDLGFAGARVAVGRSGVAVGFPRDPMLHVSWWVLAPLALLPVARLLRARRG